VEAQRTRSPAAAARARDRLAEAVAAEPEEMEAGFFLATALDQLGDWPAARAELERACPLARGAAESAVCAFKLGVVRSRVGDFPAALAAYDTSIRLGAPDAAAYANAADVLMAMGRLAEAVERYREALRIGARAPTGSTEEDVLVLAQYGLAVALDREGRPAAARDALALAARKDPGAARLRSALEPGADVFFVPPGEVHYYLGLVAEAGGRSDEAERRFRDFVAAVPKSPFLRRAQMHLAALAVERAKAVRSNDAP